MREGKKGSSSSKHELPHAVRLKSGDIIMMTGYHCFVEHVIRVCHVPYYGKP
jgi:hypothetical protein